MIDTCYVIHITLVTYHSVATTVEAPLLESRRSAVIGVLSLECRHQSAVHWSAVEVPSSECCRSAVVGVLSLECHCQSTVHWSAIGVPS